jgi:iron complex outermembrane receptor protein/outer membrane receptor for ferrienterochelin and colicins
VLPRLALFYKPNAKWSWRLAGGSGCKAADIFTLAEPSPMLFNNAKAMPAERSLGLNTDINYHTLLWDKVGIAVNQAFYFTRLNDPLVMSFDSLARQVLKTGEHTVSSYGSDTYVQMNIDELEIYLGYNHTEALQQFGPNMHWTHIFSGDATLLPLPFNPKDKLSATLAYAEEGHWRAGIEASAFFNQYIYNGQKVQNYWFWAAMVQKNFGKWSIVLNCENLFDARQAKQEALVSGPLSSPVFRPIWGPVEGRVINCSVKVDF